MHALVAFVAGPVGRYVVMIGLLLSLIAGIWVKIDRGARQAAISAVERANRAAADKADAASRDVLTCQGRWNREAGRCEP